MRGAEGLWVAVIGGWGVFFFEGGTWFIWGGGGVQGVAVN